MYFIYNITIHILYFLIRIIAYFNKKIKFFVSGHNEIASKIAVIKSKDKVIWLHSASLGEFEQGRPIIEYIKANYPLYKIVVSFFSPSGYEIRKDYELADVVCYLPIDTKSEVHKFIKQIHPELAIIIKYEFWPNLMRELKETNTNTILISGIFRENQLFFKTYGTWFRKSLDCFNHFFVQNTISKNLLNSIGIDKVTIAGDTRFDRVHKIVNQNNTLDFVNEFVNNTYTIVIGSSWKEDEELLVNYINNKATDEKFIIAPHNIKIKDIEHLKNSISKKVVLYSEKEGVNLSEYQVFIIDTIGLLTKIYAYADVAYVGGGLATGLHNILEPATFGIPIVFGGKKHKKFQEALDLIALGGATPITNQSEFTEIFDKLKSNTTYRKEVGKINADYVAKQIGATRIICDYIQLKN